MKLENFDNLEIKEVIDTSDIDYSFLEENSFDIKIFDTEDKSIYEIFDLIYTVLNKNKDTFFKKVCLNDKEKKLYFYFCGNFSEPDFFELKSNDENRAFSKLKTFCSKSEDSYSLKEVSLAIREYCKYYQSFFQKIKSSLENDTKEYKIILNYIKMRSIRVEEGIKAFVVFNVMREGYGEGLSSKYFHSDYIFDASTKQFIKEETTDEVFARNNRIIPFFYKYIDDICKIYSEVFINDTLRVDIKLSENFQFDVECCLFKNESIFDKDVSYLNYFLSDRIYQPTSNNRIIYDMKEDSIYVESLDYKFNKNVLESGGAEKIYENIFIKKCMIDEKFYKYLPERKSEIKDIKKDLNDNSSISKKDNKTTVFDKFLDFFGIK